MSSTQYSPVSQSDTSFGNPRQKTWAVFHNVYGWALELQTTSFLEAQAYAKDIIYRGGMFGGPDRIMVCEIVPIDIVITPTV
ncbi:hypothetical protein [Clostridium drakei]|uniref:Uncharacterized protein n=1 Tax=Clostridium drakei TaxID=332101 RepID=A0A2U8DPI8_9CLOT|nr:hypothetical protein [Clostridium drakei]AWI04144.1 hypothetical protein B9W14_06420 [Clostridium drakei]